MAKDYLVSTSTEITGESVVTIDFYTARDTPTDLNSACLVGIGIRDNTVKDNRAVRAARGIEAKIGPIGIGIEIWYDNPAIDNNVATFYSANRIIVRAIGYQRRS